MKAARLPGRPCLSRQRAPDGRPRRFSAQALPAQGLPPDYRDKTSRPHLTTSCTRPRCRDGRAGVRLLPGCLPTASGRPGRYPSDPAAHEPGARQEVRFCPRRCRHFLAR
jgi:hypothetical protein